MDKPSEDCVLLQQPISHEHNILLSKICREIGLDEKLLYVTNILKCNSKNPLKANFESCSCNLRNELDTLNPVAIIVCGKVPVKWFKKYQNRTYIELPSLHLLFAGKSGINQMRETLRVIKEVYIG